MQTWTVMEYLAWAISVVLGLYMVVDWFRTDTTYPEDILTSSREGELEAMTEEHKV